jgi:hypothetical protein
MSHPNEFVKLSLEEPVNEESAPVKEESAPVKEESAPVAEPVSAHVKEESAPVAEPVIAPVSAPVSAPVEEESAPAAVESGFPDITSLASIFQLLVLNQPGASKYNVVISPKIKSILESLLKDNQYFSKVEEHLKNIIKDGKLDAKDVPVVMLLLTELYDRMKNLSLKNLDTATCGDVLKIMVEVAIREKIIPVSQKDVELISCMFAIIDTGIRLIQMKNGLDDIKSGLLACVLRYVCNKTV